MSKEYYTEQAQKEIKERIDRAETLAKGWRDIKRYKTKDGKDFKNLKLNFTKGAVKQNKYRPDETDISISVRNDRGQYFDDWIDISVTVYNGTKEAEQYEKEGRLISRGAYLHPYINLTPDEIEQAIDTRASYFEAEAKELKQFLTKFDEVTSKIVGMREQAEAYIKEQPDTVYYILRKILWNGRS